MPGQLMSGLWRYMLKVPPYLWEKQIHKTRAKAAASLGFMSAEHRLVHHFVVRELPGLGRPMPPEMVSDALDMDLAGVISILDDLQEHLTFVFRNEAGEVTWAYPVTVEQTPHHTTFSSGEQIYAAWAVDAFATPFVQGRLRGEELSVEVVTQCAHCGRPMHLAIDSDMNCQAQEAGCEPIVFVPNVDFGKLEDPSIIDAFWKESVFFWSEEHAREYRRKQHRTPGAYFTTKQIAYLNNLMQSTIFGFKWSRGPWSNPWEIGETSKWSQQ